MKRVHIRILICILFLLTDCITPYVPPNAAAAPQLVVNGLITDQRGPYVVKLSIASSASTNYFSNPPVGAHVFIHDNMGNQEELKEVNSGAFETSPTGIQGVVGRSYSVVVMLSDGKRYESVPEVLNAVSPIAEIHTNYRDLPAESDQTGQFVTYVETQDPETPGNYYKWNWKHYNFRPYCYYWTDGGSFTKNPCCERCWEIDQCESCIDVLSDRLVNGKRISKFLLNIPFDSKDPYYLSIQQFSLSEGAYRFWGSVANQVNNVGGVFDPPPAAVRGNLFSVSNLEEKVLGYFGASGLSKVILYVQRNSINKPIKGYVPPYKQGLICVPCGENYFLTMVQPEGWKD